MKARTITLIALFLLGCSLGFSQQLISSTGDVFSGPYGTFSFSVGELAIESYSGSQIEITQGFHQPGLQIVGLGRPSMDPEFRVYPNPILHELHVDRLGTISEFQGSIHDNRGTHLIDLELIDQHNVVDFRSFPAGTYLVSIWNQDNGNKRIYKIIKSN